MLAGIGLPLYKAQTDKATNAVIKSNLRSVGGIVDTTKALGSTLYLDELGGNLKVKGKILVKECFIAYADANAVTVKGAGSKKGITSTTSNWCVRISGDNSNCNLEDGKLDGCTDHTGAYRKDDNSTTTEVKCVCPSGGVIIGGTDITGS